MNSTDILLHVPIAGRITIRAKMILWEMLGRHAIEDLDQFSYLPAALRQPFRRLCTLLLVKEVNSAVQHVGIMRLAGRTALTGLAANMPKAIIVAMTPTAMSSASPNDVPILVFIYSYLLRSMGA